MRTARFYRMLILLLVAQMAFVAVLNRSANAEPLGTVIYQDTFTVDGVVRQYGQGLNSTAIEGGLLKWVAPASLKFADIDGEDVVSAVSGSSSAVINADLGLVGGIVKVEADVMPLGNNPADPDRTNWVAIGFQPGQASTGHGGAGVWMLFRGNGGYQIFQNGTSRLMLSIDSLDGYVQGDVANMSITYDQVTHIVSFAIDEQVVHSEDLGATDFPAAVKHPFIITYDGGQYFDNYTVSMEGGVLPVVTVLQSPTNNALQVDVSPELSWAPAFPVDETLTFDVYMDPNETRLTNLDPSALISSQQSGFSYTTETALEYETTYFWRVVPYINGEPNQPTEVRSFLTDFEVQKWFDAAWMTDDDLDLSLGKIYTHKVEFNSATEAFVTTVLDVDFENDNDRSGANWLLSGATSAHTGSAFTGTGQGVVLNTRFFYGSPAALTLTGLTPGVEYRTTFYTHGWGNIGGRVVAVSTSDDGKTSALDENIGGNGIGRLFMYYYTAPESGMLTFDFVETITNAAWHHYSFTNEVATDIYLDPTPLPGAQLQSDLDLSWQLNGEVVNPSYNLLVGTDPNFYDVVIDESGLTETTISVSLDPEVTYYWKVQVVEDGGSVVHSSPVWNFTTSPPPDALKVLEWKMDEIAGPRADQTGTSEDAVGTLTGFNDPNASTMFVTGLVGNALLLNGTSEYVDVSNAELYMPTGDEQAFAVSAYFRTFKEFGPIFSMRNEANGTPLIDIAIGHDGAYQAPGRLRMLVRDDNNSLSGSDSGITVNDGRWHSLVVMRGEGNWKMYVDGIERARLTGVASGAVTLNWLSIGAEKYWILTQDGRWNWQNTHIRYFEGMLDEVCIWDGEMRDHQIQEHAAIVPPAGDLDFDLSTDEVDLKVASENWLMDSYTPVQTSPLVLEDMESYHPTDANSHAPYWEALEGVSPESVDGVTAPPGVGLSLNSIQPDSDGLYGKVLQWDYDFEGQSNVIERFWLRDRRVDLGLYDQISIRVKKMPGSTGEWFYFDFHDGRGITEPELADVPWDMAWKGRIILPLADLPEGEWYTLVRDIPGGLSGRPRELNDFYEVSIGISMGASGTTGIMLIDEITLTDGTDDCFPEVGVLLPDMNGDCLVNINDFAIMAGNWLQGL